MEASERANEAALKKMTDEMHDIMRDAMRNKEIPEGTVADWQNITEQLEQKADPPMQEAAQSLQQGAQQPGARESQLGQAQKQQQEALDAMRNAAKKMNTTNESLYARNFYNRMRAAASAEHNISSGLKGLAKETAGLKTDEIAPSKIKEFSVAADKQVANTKDVDGISNDMATFIKRVPNEKYEAVEKEMSEKRVVAELTDLAGFVRQNLGLKSVGRARQWGDQLDQWASMLQSECNQAVVAVRSISDGHGIQAGLHGARRSGAGRHSRADATGRPGQGREHALCRRCDEARQSAAGLERHSRRPFAEDHV